METYYRIWKNNIANKNLSVRKTRQNRLIFFQTVHVWQEKETFTQNRELSNFNNI